MLCFFDRNFDRVRTMILYGVPYEDVCKAIMDTESDVEVGDVYLLIKAAVVALAN